MLILLLIHIYAFYYLLNILHLINIILVYIKYFLILILIDNKYNLTYQTFLILNFIVMKILLVLALLYLINLFDVYDLRIYLFISNLDIMIIHMNGNTFNMCLQIMLDRIKRILEKLLMYGNCVIMLRFICFLGLLRINYVQNQDKEVGDN